MFLPLWAWVVFLSFALVLSAVRKRKEKNLLKQRGAEIEAEQGRKAREEHQN
jgi:hypothetical protein